MLWAATVCFTGWAVLMTRRGEVRPDADYPATQDDLDASRAVIRYLVETIEAVYRQRIGTTDARGLMAMRRS